MINNIKNFNGRMVRNDETYLLLDDDRLQNLVVSKTILKAGKSTRGHKHDGLDEVYIFFGAAIIKLDGIEYEVKNGDIVLVPQGVHHQVINPKIRRKLEFIAIFQKYNR